MLHTWDSQTALCASELVDADVSAETPSATRGQGMMEGEREEVKREILTFCSRCSA